MNAPLWDFAMAAGFSACQSLSFRFFRRLPLAVLLALVFALAGQPVLAAPGGQLGPGTFSPGQSGQASQQEQGGQAGQGSAAAQSGLTKPDIAGADWRIRILDAAVVNGPNVTLGDIGQVHGTPPPGVWEKLASRPLWPAPAEQGKPLQVNRARLAQALRETLGKVADLCLLPSSMAIQSGGQVLREEDLRALVVRELTPKLNALSGQAEVDDFRLPPYAFLAHSGQSIALETGRIGPGRLPLRFVVQEVDGSALRRFTGTVMINLWADVPCAGQPLNRGDAVGPEQITWIRKNLTFLRGEIWDGRGGPWEAQRAIGTGQPIYIADIGPLTLVRKGAIVTLRYSRGAVRLSAKVEALGDGGPGSTISVRNLQTKKQIFAVVIDSETVEVK